MGLWQVKKWLFSNAEGCLSGRTILIMENEVTRSRRTTSNFHTQCHPVKTSETSFWVFGYVLLFWTVNLLLISCFKMNGRSLWKKKKKPGIYDWQYETFQSSLIEHTFMPCGGSVVLEMYIHLLVSSVPHFIILHKLSHFKEKGTIIYMSITLLGFTPQVSHAGTHCSLSKW